MDTQRLRNLTTGRLHTEVSYIYQDLEYLSGMGSLFTHMLPNVARAMEPWLKEKVTDPRYWDGEYDTTHTGEYDIAPMNAEEKEAMLERYATLPSLLDNLGV